MSVSFFRVINCVVMFFFVKKKKQLIIFYIFYSQREATTLRDLTDKLEHELKNKEEQQQVSQEKIKTVTDKLDMSEQKLLEFASMPDIEDQLKDRMEALQQVSFARKRTLVKYRVFKLALYILKSIL